MNIATTVELNSKATSLAASQTVTPSAQVQAPAKVQSSAKAQTSAKEDTVQLSTTAIRALTYPPPKAPQVPPTFDQIIRQAADGDIRALAQLALV